VKVTTETDFEIVVEPKTSVYGISLDFERRDAEEMAAQIRRHVDGVRSAWVRCKTEETCSHCEYGWEVDETSGLPLCCDQAQAEWMAAHLIASFGGFPIPVFE
jgi:hypothetical protein